MNEKILQEIHTREFDIVIPIGPNDISLINQQIEFTKKNVIGYRNIYLVSYDPSLEVAGCITIDENIFPFNKMTVAEEHTASWRNGWYLQQLLKLYAGLLIPGIMDKYLVIDSDTFFVKPATFIENGKCLYNYGTEFHIPYFQHMERLHPSFRKMVEQSGICHHMMFETKYVKEIISLVEELHNQKFYKVFLSKVSKFDILHSGASEYEIYFNYILANHNDSINIRPLQWENVSTLNNFGNNVYVSYHHYCR